MKRFWHQHTWEKWSGAVQDYRGSNHQLRRCATCGAIKRRLIVSIMTSQLMAGQINTAVGPALPDA